MSNVFYGSEIKDAVTAAVAEEISNVIHDPKWADASPEAKLNIIKGIYILASAINNRFEEKEEDQ